MLLLHSNLTQNQALLAGFNMTVDNIR